MSEIYQFSRSFMAFCYSTSEFSSFFRSESFRIYIFALKFECRGSTNKKSPTTRYRYSRIYPYCVFLFYTPITPNEALIVKYELITLMKERHIIAALKNEAMIVILRSRANSK